MLDGSITDGVSLSLGENRVALSVAHDEDPVVARGVLERFARRHGASSTRVTTLTDVARKLSQVLLERAGGGLLEAERVGSFIEVRAVGKSSVAGVDETPPMAADSHEDWSLSLVLAEMDGVELSEPGARRIAVRAWCGLD